jgi:rod shape-determining protein MreC
LKGLPQNSRTLLWVFFIAFFLLLLSMNSGQKGQWNPLEQIVIEVTVPIERLFQRTVAWTEDFWSNYFFLVNVRRENTALKREVDALKVENSRYREQLFTYDRLKALLQFKQSLNIPAVAAQVIGLDPTGWFKSVIIDKGTSAEISMDMPVVNASGVVGRVVSVSPHYAKILLLIDQNSAVDSLIQRSRDRGMVRGLGRETCSLDYMIKTSDVQEGDKVVTSGLGGVYPKGIPIGQVIHVEDSPGDLFKHITVKPAVDFSRLEEVLVILRKKVSSEEQNKKR